MSGERTTEQRTVWAPTPKTGSVSPAREDPLVETSDAFAPPVETGVLLIESDDDVARAFADELNERLAPANVIRVRSVREALTIGLGGTDCIVLDLEGLEGLSGIEAVRQLRTGVSDYIPVVVLLVGEDEATGEAALRFGSQAYLPKQAIEPGVLARSVRSVVRRQQLEMAEHELFLAQAQAREAVRLERGLAPQPLLRGGSAWVASVYRTGRSRALLGGDFTDLVQVTRDRIRVLVGDVCGHGPDEAAVGASLRAAWRALALSGRGMVGTVRTLETIFVEERHLPGLFVTLCTLDIDLSEMTAEVLLAGHPRPVLISENAGSAISAGGGRALGIGSGEWATERYSLPRDWAILCYTDGLIEGRTGDGPRRLGEAGLHALIKQRMEARPHWQMAPRELLNEIVGASEDLNHGPLSDDVAMLLIGPGAPRGDS
jgi:serine phosphatase RsbU (regulator of sigma subunit)